MQDIRWHQRFDNLEKAHQTFQLALAANREDPTHKLLQMALIQAFEFTYELGWKTLKDYLKYSGIDLQLPREVIKQAFTSHLIEDGQAWIEMLEDRNLMAFAYDDTKAKQAIEDIMNRYAPALEQVYRTLQEKHRQAICC